MIASLIASLLLAAWLAQAEPAPPEPALPPRVTDPGPAEAWPGPPTPANPGAPGTPAVPPPSAAPPPSPAAPGSASPPPLRLPPPANTVSLLGGLASRLGSEALAVGPAVGFSFGVSFQRRYAALSPEVELGLAADFLFDRFSTSVIATSTVGPGVDQNYVGTRSITQTTFGLLQTMGVHAGATRVWLGGGGGLSVGFFSTAENALRPGNATAQQLFARGVAGGDVTINDQTSLGVRVGYTVMLTSGSFTTGTGQVVDPFSDLLDIHAGLFYRFR